MNEAEDLAAIAGRHGFTEGAAEAALDALRSGHGRMAQFSHPEFGGLGQWSPGMTMIGSMFDAGLKARVEALFDELAKGGVSRADTPSADLPSAAARSDGDSAPSGDWWPSDLGRPSSTGSQNDMRYALFPDKRRLAIRDGGRVSLYDTGEHRISGFGQQQGGTQTLSLSGGAGSLSLDDLTRVTTEAAEPPERAPAPRRPQEPRRPQSSSPSPSSSATSSSATSSSAREDALGTLERLADLHRRGIVSEHEFAAKKADLLSRV